MGKEFNPNSLSRLLSNKRYVGVYIYKGRETLGGMPRILDGELLYRVQDMMNKNKTAPARTHGAGEYFLTTKLFCGYCKEMMTGYGGTGKSGRAYHYYAFKKAKKKQCHKKIVYKKFIEDIVVAECLKILTDEKIAFIAKRVAEECGKNPDNISVRSLKAAIEKSELEAQLAIEENKRINLTEPQIRAFLDFVREMPDDDINKRRALINIFVHSIYLYDDHFTMIINASKRPLTIENIPLDEIESAFEGGKDSSEGCSSMKTPAPAHR